VIGNAAVRFSSAAISRSLCALTASRNSAAAASRPSACRWRERQRSRSTHSACRQTRQGRPCRERGAPEGTAGRRFGLTVSAYGRGRRRHRYGRGRRRARRRRPRARRRGRRRRVGSASAAAGSAGRRRRSPELSPSERRGRIRRRRRCAPRIRCRTRSLRSVTALRFRQPIRLCLRSRRCVPTAPGVPPRHRPPDDVEEHVLRRPACGCRRPRRPPRRRLREPPRPRPSSGQSCGTGRRLPRSRRRCRRRYLPARRFGPETRR